MARQDARETDNARFFGSLGPAGRALSAFGTSALVPILLIAVILGSWPAIVGSLGAILVLVWSTLRAMRVGYRLDGHVLTPCHASGRASGRAVDLTSVERTGRQRRDQLVLEMRHDADGRESDESPVHLELRKLSMDSAVRLRLVMESEFGIDCSTWGVTGTERVRRDREQDASDRSRP